MNRLLGALILGIALSALLFAVAVRPRAQPLLIDAAVSPAAMGGTWCGHRPGPPLLGPPRHNYDYQPGGRRIGGVA